MTNNAKFFAVHMLGAEPHRTAAGHAVRAQGARYFARAYRTLIFLPTLLSVVITGYIPKQS